MAAAPIKIGAREPSSPRRQSPRGDGALALRNALMRDQPPNNFSPISPKSPKNKPGVWCLHETDPALQRKMQTPLRRRSPAREKKIPPPALERFPVHFTLKSRRYILPSQRLIQ